jgi:hypothetical protein
MRKRLIIALACAWIGSHAEAWGQGFLDRLVHPAAADSADVGPAPGTPGPYMMAGPAGVQPMGMQPPMGVQPPMGMQPPMPMQGPGMAGPQTPMTGYMPPGAYGGQAEGVDMVYRGPWGACDWGGFGEFLYMRPRNASLAYAVPFSGPLAVPPGAPQSTPIQVAPPGTVDIDYQPAWRAGVTRALGDCVALQVTYSHFQGDDKNSISTDANPNNLIRSMVMQPSTWTANADDDATYNIKYDLADVDYRWTFATEREWCATMLVGLRYAALDQEFNSNFGAGISSTVATRIRYEGAGLRFGLEGERRGNLGLFVYGRSAASFVCGNARAAYQQSNAFQGTIVDTGFHADRIVSMLDLELGAGWASPNDRLRISAGYMLSGWFNVVRTDQFISAVQQNNFVGLGDTLTFDGFTGRIELRF